MKIYIDWYNTSICDAILDRCKALYAYLHPDTSEILYIGKAYRCSARKRLSGKHKKDIYNWLEENYGVHHFNILIGFPESEDIGRWTDALFCDIESLLIKRLKPPCNIMNTRTRNISRPGMKVHCNGDWPLQKSVFFDRG